MVGVRSGKSLPYSFHSAFKWILKRQLLHSQFIKHIKNIANDFNLIKLEKSNDVRSSYPPIQLKSCKYPKMWNLMPIQRKIIVLLTLFTKIGFHIWCSAVKQAAG